MHPTTEWYYLPPKEACLIYGKIGDKGVLIGGRRDKISP
jgi:hypothetical protein